jgi:mercuric ion transport protein
MIDKSKNESPLSGHYKEQQTPKKSGTSLFAGGGALSGLFAFIGASCCVLPLALVNLGVSTALVGNLAFFARYDAWFKWGAFALVIISFFLVFRQKRPNAKVIAILLFGTALTGLAFIFPYFEADLFQWLARR